MIKKELLNVRNLSVNFDAFNGTVYAVRDVSFTVYEGEILAMVGESGCGKSVTAKAVMRLLDRTSAKCSERSEIEFEGKDMLRLSRRELDQIRGKEISMVFQDPMTAIDPTMSVGKQMAETVRKHTGCGRGQAWNKSADLLKQVELSDPEDMLKRYPNELSGGQLQRIMIAMALSCDPKLMIADEFTTALDVTVQAEILDLLKRLQSMRKMSVLLITHDLGIVAGIADRVQVMYSGRIVERGTVGEIFKHPRHPYTAGLLLSLPGQKQEREDRLRALPGSPPDLRLMLQGCSFAPRCRYSMRVCKKCAPEEKDNVSCWLSDPRAPGVDLLQQEI